MKKRITCVLVRKNDDDHAVCLLYAWVRSRFDWYSKHGVILHCNPNLSYDVVCAGIIYFSVSSIYLDDLSGTLQPKEGDLEKAADIISKSFNKLVFYKKRDRIFDLYTKFLYDHPDQPYELWVIPNSCYCSTYIFNESKTMSCRYVHSHCRTLSRGRKASSQTRQCTTASKKNGTRVNGFAKPKRCLDDPIVKLQTDPKLLQRKRYQRLIATRLATTGEGSF